MTEIERLQASLATAMETLKDVLAALVAMTSIVIRAEDEKKQPSKVVASDKMFRQMLVDYDKATIKARAALATISAGTAEHPDSGKDCPNGACPGRAMCLDCADDPPAEHPDSVRLDPLRIPTMNEVYNFARSNPKTFAEIAAEILGGTNGQ